MNGYKAGVEEAGGTFLSDEVQYADATADRATTAMEAIMQTHPEGIAIICANNDDMAMAAARAAQGHDAYKNTIFLGFNGDRAACEAILAGQMTMSSLRIGRKTLQRSANPLWTNANFQDPFSHSISLYGGAPCFFSRSRGHCCE